MTTLATIEDYELLIAPVAAADLERVTYLLDVASSVVAGVAPGLLPWTHYDPDDPEAVDPGPVPAPATLVTCQTTSRMVEEPTGGDGALTMERVGLVERGYQPTWESASGLLPSGWRVVLREWVAPAFASVRLSVPHPAAYRFGGYGGDWFFPLDSVEDGRYV
jgi:hypothetical protein